MFALLVAAWPAYYSCRSDVEMVPAWASAVQPQLNQNNGRDLARVLGHRAEQVPGSKSRTPKSRTDIFPFR